MSDEIKEILDNLKYTAKKHTIQVLENGEKIEHCSQEIETELRLNTYSANILLDYITNLQESEAYYYGQYKDHKSRNEKAIEYINNFWKKKSYYEDIDNCMKYATINEFDKADLLNILQGR